MPGSLRCTVTPRAGVLYLQPTSYLALAYPHSQLAPGEHQGTSLTQETFHLSHLWLSAGLSVTSNPHNPLR